MVARTGLTKTRVVSLDSVYEICTTGNAIGILRPAVIL
jgi:hypothetical protein